MKNNKNTSKILLVLTVIIIGVSIYYVSDKAINNNDKKEQVPHKHNSSCNHKKVIKHAPVVLDKSIVNNVEALKKRRKFLIIEKNKNYRSIHFTKTEKYELAGNMAADELATITTVDSLQREQVIKAYKKALQARLEIYHSDLKGEQRKTAIRNTFNYYIFDLRKIFGSLIVPKWKEKQKETVSSLGGIISEIRLINKQIKKLNSNKN